MRNEVYLMDCMEIMAGLPDNAYDLAIVDPPYGIDAASDIRGGTKYGKAIAESKSYGAKVWDKTAPPVEYFDEIRRISVNQIIWGANHFIDRIPIPSPCWIVWDKETGTNGYADCELALTTFPTAVRKFVFQWKGMLQGNMKHKESRIHPTQKPVALYKWLLQNYAKPGQRIFDSHVGSGSIRIACHDLGFDFVGTEIDADYHAAQEERFRRHAAQGELFGAAEIQDSVYKNV